MPVGHFSAERTRLATLNVPFLCSLPEGPLHTAMKLTTGGRGAFTFEGLDRSELLTAFK